MPTKAEVFEAHGGDVDYILSAWPNIDPAGYAAWERTALRRLLAADVRAWQRRQTVRIDADAGKADSGQARLVDVPTRRRAVPMRAKVTTDAGAVDFLGLSGPAGARTLRQAALRDKPGAVTTLSRCERLLAIADLLDAESAEQGRPVTVAEVIERVAA